jgi:hypothetical protein
MPELGFSIRGAKPALFTATPQICFELRIENSPPDELIHSVLLRTQVRIDVTRRKYTSSERLRLHELFGPASDWSRTPSSLLWAQVSSGVPAFSGGVDFEIPVPTSSDFDLAITKYLNALESEVIPVTFLFSGTVFYRGAGSELSVWQIPWNRESSFELPLDVHAQVMSHHHPNELPLLLNRDVFERLRRFRTEQGLLTWEQALEKLLASAEKPAASPRNALVARGEAG